MNFSIQLHIANINSNISFMPILKKSLHRLALLAMIVLLFGWSNLPDDTIISAGSQPQISLDKAGIVRVVFGRSDSIFCSTSKNNGTDFSKPMLVGYVPGMHLGMTRGPQIASSAHYSIITAIDKTGNIHFFQLMQPGDHWQYKGLLNDKASSAPEGLMSITADAKDNFYAVWLDIRNDKKNNICFSSLTGRTGKWKKNALVYISPDEHVCECCKPSIAVKGEKVAIMYRNWLQGSRDLYLITSDNGGKTFGKASKLGAGTWKLKGCPMDGGGLEIDTKGLIHTVWQREGTVYYCKPDESEVQLTKGRSCSIAADKTDSKQPFITFEAGGAVKLLNLKDNNEVMVGKGTFLKSVIFNDMVLCVWEQDKQILFKQVPLVSPGTVLLSK